jgi:hypothetical protein
MSLSEEDWEKYALRLSKCIDGSITYDNMEHYRATIENLQRMLINRGANPNDVKSYHRRIVKAYDLCLLPDKQIASDSVVFKSTDWVG